MIDVYTYMEFPWISKSTYKLWKACKFKFKWLVLEKYRPGQNRWMAQGTGLHRLYYEFFDVIDFDVLWELDWSMNTGTKESPVFRYFYASLLSIIPDNAKNKRGEIEDKHMTYNIRNFALLQENLYVDARLEFKTKKEVKNYFMVGISRREYFMKHEGFKIFGTVDVKYYENGKTIIGDYKTGNIPKKLKEEIRSDIYTKVNLGHYTMEGNFYVLLQSLIDGYDWELRPDKKGKMIWVMLKDGKDVTKKLKDLYDYAFIFTSSDELEYFVARKKASVQSVRAILNNLPLIRGWDDWYREPNIMRCKNCQLYYQKCKGEVPFEIYGDVLGREEATQESVHDANWSDT